VRLSHLATGWLMTARELLRSRIVLILLFLIPALFYAIVALTTTGRVITFKLASISEDTFVEVSERSESLIFIGTAAVGLLASFLALSLVQKHAAVNRRLILCGYRPAELIVSKLGVLFCVIVLIGAYVAAMLPIFFRPERITLVALGFALGGYVYGCYGLLVGSIFRRELEGILFIVLLANIDAGWLQNPVFYAGAQNRGIVRSLPAYFPSQASMIAAFTQHSFVKPLIGSLIYGTVLLLVAMTIYFWRMRTRK
jgi:hypothetical protein